jgi:hypothetical protein
MVLKVYSNTLRILKEKPVIYLPFLIAALLEVLALLILFLAPRMPFVKLFGPPIRAFYAERFLHYPANFILLPILFSKAKMLISIIFTSLLTGLAISLTSNYYYRKQVNLSESFKQTLKRYGSLFFIFLLLIVFFQLSAKGLNIVVSKALDAGQLRSVIALLLNFTLAILVQAVFIYVIPVLIVEKKGLFKSLGNALVVFKKFFISTIILIGIPMLLYLPVIILQANSLFLIHRLFPESILLLSLAGIVISSLIIDPIITLSAAYLYMMQKEKAS